MAVPELRFNGFLEDWTVYNFSQLYSFKTTNSLSRDKLNYERGDVKNIHYGDIHKIFKTQFNISQEKVPYINEDVDLSKIKKENYCLEGDLVIADASEDYSDIGKSIEIINLDNQKVLAGLHTFLARPSSDETYIGFTSYILKSWRLRKQIMTIAQGTKVLSISTGRLNKIKLTIPSLPEQQKIASFLTAVDKRIGLLQRKATLLEDYKKGVMQKLFAQQLRFKDDNGQYFPDWEEKKLGEYLMQKNSRNKNLEEKLVLSVSNKKGFISQSEQFDGYEVASKDLSNYKIVYKNQIAYNPSRINVGSIAVLKDFEKGIVSPMYIIFALKNLNTTYFENLLNTHKVNHLIKVGCSGSVRDSLNFKDLSDFKLKFPSFKEQQKIASFLESLDKKTATVNQQIEGMQTFKKGLLQQMFV